MAHPHHSAFATEAGLAALSQSARPRRLRHTPLMREAAADVDVRPRHLMAPFFVLPGETGEEPIAAMPGVARLGLTPLLRQVEAHLASGVNKFILFGVPPAAAKDDLASAAVAPEGIVPTAVRRLKQTFGHDLLLATDVCLCAYMRHGHCGVLRRGQVQNDASLPILANMAVCHAEAGADMVAPSDMMDGRVGAIRQALDRKDLSDTALMSYSVKYSSAYYGPFREAAGSAPALGDRRSYQMDVRSRFAALREAALDTAEGADWLMVKPSLAFLDVIAQLRAHSHLPLACYNVSGEYSMVKLAAQAGALDEAAVVRENFLAMRRAGADLILTYHALDAAVGRWLDE